MNYAQFFDNPPRAYIGPDKDLGYPALATMLAMDPDFFVASGDNVYYDVPFQGRDYRSPNMMEPGPGKILWGAEQLEWFKRTLAESDATFKILISPMPMVGPDDAKQAERPSDNHDSLKRDNHSNPQGF